MTLLDTIKDLARGSVLRCPGSFPYEAIVDFMVVEFPMGGERTYALMVVSGYKAGLLYVVLPSESRPANGEGYAIDANWLRNNWAKWGYPDCQLSEVQLIEPYISSYVSE
ncbi:Imm45 family immunity protein [Xanthomonas sp. WHRI 10064A]|uniref:Imm45 family immunity protein n=1 Tax=unclassified Xanthomonas TaxID=2643310 RepID=UPI002B23AD3E|nr:MULTISPECIES: Imm45 family immunity protein [unclassified Xanthomonas]MEA9585904.1 Imm45 family immunity protein [Xanthomonas sp. WHRI 10064B]MEA9614331.1 Imm45 family immunity protein [Xanthomonas sp. WHRI 10064A]